ncbi:3-oxoacyl-[acyl-carrier protein] reductase [Actinopolyspora mzabensis]|uniref:3-oxoacyl-[acyl-carrier protein] reductase n=1 Tax=Actinopolyspora mzabensis TaxID=995066 RepID=A0A1G9FIK7_ACTMZ|nr:SDR family oxidoreductase [Actinopolyspora mzabensis]SDK88241.1 3-oxoacyl-[acyl-carrier protein] reductase [Actinopolyspora mzabensis]
MGSAGRTAVVTGVSRRQGIGFAVARRLLSAGMRVCAQGWSPHDVELGLSGGAETASPEFRAELGGSAETFSHVELDLAEPEAPAELLRQATERFGSVDTLVLAHARSSDFDLDALSATELDLCWAVNVRASLLLVREFARRYRDGEHEEGEHGEGRREGRIVLFTSGQHLAPMSGEIPYAATKGTLHQLTPTLSDALVERGITVNCVNPGPTDTGWATEELTASVGRALPRGRWNTPEEAAGVVELLLDERATTITGQVLDAEAGFRRWVR